MKHMLRIAVTGALPPTTHVYFQCENCTANIHIEHAVMVKLLVDGDKRLNDVDFEKWGVCIGSGKPLMRVLTPDDRIIYDKDGVPSVITTLKMKKRR